MTKTSNARPEAMSVGSLFGWHVPGADVTRYDEKTGKLAVRS